MSQSKLKRRRLDFRSWPEVLADVDQLRQAGYERAGNWDLSQICDHVGDGLRAAVYGTERRASWVIRKLLAPIVLRRILRDRRMKAGIKVPDWWLPGPAHDESAAVEQFRGEVAAFQSLTTRPCAHPLFGQLSKEQWLELVLIHAGHHLSFLVPRTSNGS